MKQYQKIQTVFLSEHEIIRKVTLKESMTLDEAISFFEKGEIKELENDDIITQEFFMKPLLRMADRIV